MKIFNLFVNNRLCQSSVALLFSQTFYWLIYDSHDLQMTRAPQQADVLGELNRTNLHVDTEITYADLRQQTVDTNNGSAVWHVPLYDVYNNGYDAGGRLRCNYDARFSFDTTTMEHLLSRAITDATQKYVRRSDLSDLTLRVGTVYQIIDNRRLTNESIIEHLMSENNTQYDVLNRPTFQMAIEIQRLLGYRARFRHYNAWSLNDTSGGALGDGVQKSEVDVAYVIAGLNFNRLCWMFPIVEMRDFRSVFIFRTFGSQKAGLIENVFFKPFHVTVWCTLAASVAVLAVGIYVVHRIEYARIDDGDDGNRGNAERPSAQLSAMTVLSAFCQQGAGDVQPMSTYGRCLMLVVYVTSILTYSYYTTEVLNALIGSPVKTNIRSLKQLAMSSMSVGLENISHTLTYVRVSLCFNGFMLQRSLNKSQN